MNLTQNEKTVTIIIAEDHKHLREVYVSAMERFNIKTIGQAANGKETLELLKTHQPDVLLLDLNMPVMDGNKTMDKIQKDYPQTKVIVLSFYDSQMLIDDYLSRGAKGYIPKDAGDDYILADAIKKVSLGEIVIIKPRNKKQDFNNGYTKKQSKIIPLICEGMTNKEIAQEIGVHERAIEKQRQRIYLKTGSTRTAGFFKYVYEKGLNFLRIIKE